MDQLISLSEFRKSIATAKNLSEVKTLRDHGHSAVAHAKRIGTATKSQLAEAMAAVLEAERKAGELLSKMSLAGRGGGDAKSSNSKLLDRLADLGIAKIQSHRWQSVSKIPQKQFREWIDSHLSEGKIPTSSGLYAYSRKITGDSIPESTEPTLVELVGDVREAICDLADSWTDEHFETLWSVAMQELRLVKERHDAS